MTGKELTEFCRAVCDSIAAVCEVFFFDGCCYSVEAAIDLADVWITAEGADAPGLELN